jgi:hypothetical protein
VRTINELRRVTIAGRDGELGSVRDLYFDNLNWTVRYLVVDTGSWLPDRWVLVSPTSVRRWDADPTTLRVALTRTQFKACVDMNTRPGVDQPIKRQAQEWQEPHLQAATTLMGYALETEDGEIGHVEDLLIDDTAWIIRYLRVGTKNKWAGTSVLVAPQWLTEVTSDDSKRFFCIATAVDDRASSGRTAVSPAEYRYPGSLRSSAGGTRNRVRGLRGSS